ncbi:extracellular solute-binding protein [Fibrobacter sp. UWB11]|uniref:extracellular solute-binding protein n=1 Tax=Fibrobacter sp. UWB11 TaxID=1896202 RepID=UPI00092BB2F8|nr:extracellular solute-binding protein [Fibrobacter sp. UWB11]SIO40720.1 multiple sugar transport system substrate-binding protein [Fibrobacter sp. UWB11]
MIGLVKKIGHAGFARLALCVGLMLGAFTTEAAAADTLSIWVMDNGLGSKNAMNRLVKKFYRETGIPVKLTSLSWGEAFNRITRTFADSNEIAPDVIQLGSTWVPHFASIGYIRPIDFMMAKIDSARFLGEGLRSSHISGRPGTYAVPWFIDVRGFFVNERIWQELGFDDSDFESYSHFLGVLKTIANTDLTTEAGVKVTPFALPGKNDWAGQQCMAPFVWSHGGDFVVPAGKGYRSALLDSNTLVGLALYATIMGDAQMAPHSLYENSSDNADGFVRAERVIHYGTSELIKQLDYPVEVGGLANSAIAKDGIKVLNLPSGTHGRFSFMGGSHLALGHKKDSSKYALAEQLLAYMLRADNIDAFSRQVGFLPADRSILHIWNRDSRYSKLVAELEHSRSFPNIPEWGEIENVLIDLSNKMGALFASTKHKKKRSAALAQIVYDANARINEILAYSDSLNYAEKLHWVQRFFLEDYKETYPKNAANLIGRNEMPTADEIKYKFVSSKFLFASIGAGFLVLCVIVVCVVRRRKNKSR